VEVICVERSEAGEGPLNEVVLRGRVSGDPQARELPSGTTLVSFRLVLARDRTPMTASSKQVSDWVLCCAWGGRARRQAAGWHDGDLVELSGSLRSRYHRAPAQAGTRVEVEMLAGRLLRRADRRGRESPRAVNS
jgi:single-strand DNA-binding protein